jgi:hypothetical protein
VQVSAVVVESARPRGVEVERLPTNSAFCVSPAELEAAHTPCAPGRRNTARSPSGTKLSGVLVLVGSGFTARYVSHAIGDSARSFERSRTPSSRVTP